MPDDTSAPPAPLPARPSRRRQVVIIVLALVLALVVTFHFLLWPTSRLTDDPDDLGPEFTQVMKRIQDENDWVMKQDPDGHVTIVLMLPLDTDDRDNPLGVRALRHAMQGAHLAQVWRNRESGQANASPYIRLLVRDISHDGESAVEDIERERDGQRIVAVAGLGASTAETAQVIDRLRRGPVAMSAAVLTSDELQALPGLVRMAPLNSQEAAAAVDFVKKMKMARTSAIVVRDTNPRDSYSATLAKSFESDFKDAKGTADKLHSALTFDGSSGSAAVLLDIIAQRVCASDVNVIFYAGRADGIPALLQSLTKQIGCTEREINVITGDDASELNHGVKDPHWVDPTGNIRLYYTALAHPAILQTLPSIKARFGMGKHGYSTMFPEEPLDDTHAIMHHDAVFAVIKAVDALVARGRTMPSTKDVADVLRSGGIMVEGASGNFTIDQHGNPGSKRIPVLRLNPYGSAVYVTLATGPARRANP